MESLVNAIADDISMHDDDEENWPACKALLACSGILAIYLLVVLKFLPKFMKNKPAFQMKYVLKVYNFFQVLYSLYLVIKNHESFLGHDVYSYAASHHFSRTVSVAERRRRPRPAPRAAAGC
ncbi:Elongation of very long chain fatty acids protein 4 [Eumeta japonica]|uniref:Elongation of very long chain fatty acids protein 4 n=1 Tax=Eumeta variegata TaxID=151549 RepID=A0A4C1Z8P0_EUMVA|nr:Elongation of very long chain fatty acids protein 4 [Eumeta japonica]